MAARANLQFGGFRLSLVLWVLGALSVVFVLFQFVFMLPRLLDISLPQLTIWATQTGGRGLLGRRVLSDLGLPDQ